MWGCTGPQAGSAARLHQVVQAGWWGRQALGALAPLCWRLLAAEASCGRSAPAWSLAGGRAWCPCRRKAMLDWVRRWAVLCKLGSACHTGEAGQCAVACVLWSRHSTARSWGGVRGGRERAASKGPVRLASGQRGSQHGGKGAGAVTIR